MRVLQVGLLLAAMCVAGTARAASDTPMQFSTFWPCSGNASFCGIRILAQGVIQRDSGQRLAQFLANQKLHADALPPRPTVVFDSPGGDIAGALSLGRAIRKSRMDTELGKSYSRVKPNGGFEEETIVKVPICASACALSFAGGMTRSIETDARMGIHQFSAVNGSIGDSATQVTVVVLASYLEEMGVQRSLLDRASLVSPNSMLWLSESESRLYGLDNTEPAQAPWRVVATTQGEAILEVVQSVSQGRDVSLRFGVTKQMILLSASTILAKSVYRPDRISQFPVGEPAEISLCNGQSCIQTRSVRAWARKDTASEVSFQALVAVTPAELRFLSNATVLSIRDDFGTATSDISLQTDLSTSGFASGTALLLRLLK